MKAMFYGFGATLDESAGAAQRRRAASTTGRVDLTFLFDLFVEQLDAIRITRR